MHEILVSTGLAQLYPQAAQFFGSAHFDYTSRGQSTVMEVYDHLSALNQLLVIAQQLQDDMHARRFKYAAHKLALLYQAVNLSKLRRQELRDRIEQRFDEVKSATDGAGSFSGDLRADLVEWLVSLCADVIAMAREVPPSVPHKLAPLRRLFSYGAADAMSRIPQS